MWIIYVNQEIQGLREILKESRDDMDMCKMANEELESAVEEEKEIQQELLLKMLPKDEADSRNCILEVRAGDFFLEMADFTNIFDCAVSTFSLPV